MKWRPPNPTQHALVALAQRRPDMVPLNVVMPGEDSYGLARQIRSLEGCPIMFLSSLGAGRNTPRDGASPAHAP